MRITLDGRAMPHSFLIQSAGHASRRPLRSGIALCLACVLGSAPSLVPHQAQAQAQAQATTVQRIIAVVNSEIITEQELRARILLAIVISGLPDTTDTRQRIAPQVLRALIDERLEIQESKRLKLDADETDVDKAFDNIAQRNNMTRDQLTQFLGSRGVAAGLVRDQLRAQIDWIRVVQREVRPKVVVTEDQISLAMRAPNTANEEVRLSEILLPVYEPGQLKAVMEDARQLTQEVRNGANFNSVARQFSAAQSKDNGGDLGWVPVSSVLPDLQPIIGRLQPGQVSDPVETPVGIHIFYVSERRAAGAQAGQNDRNAVRQQLSQSQLERLAERYLRDLRRNAFIDIRASG
ncbi:peptidyl-prolyl cis-trans isomerase SurA [Arboricoccus pini]|uniref:Parvulin-like PPIase n=1 Tax=Arboricoccus pini TaxID=1963835 RepID=A0A212Q7W2_9PROT|nr:peptidylprolyl isomerase [Arboricoccus pini]SNB55412.1 peptidyl-prolyl cis-trans isomerase SurA [Arboricoccus pini]